MAHFAYVLHRKNLIWVEAQVSNDYYNFQLLFNRPILLELLKIRPAPTKLMSGVC